MNAIAMWVLFVVWMLVAAKYVVENTRLQKERDIWRDAVLDHLAETGLEIDDHPQTIVERVIDWHVSVALDPATNGDMVLIDISEEGVQRALGIRLGLDHAFRDLVRGDTMPIGYSKVYVVQELVKALRRGDGVPTIDLDAVAWHDIKKAASESTWMPPEYTANDWHADVVDFLRNGPPQKVIVWSTGAGPNWFFLAELTDRKFSDGVGDLTIPAYRTIDDVRPAELVQQAEAFKSYVHQRLDAMGVPPESEHGVGGRLDWVEATVRRWALIECRWNGMKTSEGERFLDTLGIEGDVMLTLSETLDKELP